MATAIPTPPAPAAPAERVHVTVTPGVCGGRPCIAGHRIRVQDIYVMHEYQGRSADEIVHSYPQLTHGDVYAALAYFWDNRESMMAAMREEDEFVGRMRKAQPSVVGAKLEMVTQQGWGGDAVPPR